jgi:radical SAM protein with 4Fe4S-binding SPASM domain
MRRMSAKVPFAPDFDHLIYMRVFEGCNLHCEHCFIPKNPKRMTHDLIARTANDFRKFTKPGDTVLIQWHGGEPTMFGAKWLSDAIDAVEAAAPELKFEHGIQTNLMTYDESWAELYRTRFNSNVGVSYDPKIRLLTRGKPETNVEYEKRFWASLDRLIADGLEPYVVMTATSIFFEAYRNPSRLFNMLADKGIRRGHIERLTETGYARENWSKLGVDNRAYSAGMSRLLQAYRLWKSVEGNEDRLHLSPFDGLMQSIERLDQGLVGYGCWSGKCDTRFHTVDSNGYKMGCTALTSEVDNKSANGEVLVFSETYAKTREKRQIINCTGCAFRSICSSGCLAISMDDGSGECSGGKGLFETANKLHKLNLSAK